MVTRFPGLAAAFVLLLAGGLAPASSGAQAVVPPPPWAKSVEAIDDGVPVMRSPGASAARRGTVERGTRLPLRRRLAAEGCPTGIAFEVGVEAFVCEDLVAPSPHVPGGVALPVLSSGDLLPSRHAFVRWDAARAFAHPSDALTDDYVEAFQEGFGLVVTGRTTYDGMAFLQTRKGLWVPAEALRPVRGSDFQGRALEDGEALDLAWVRREGAPVRDGERGRVVRKASRREVVRVAEVRGSVAALRDGTRMDVRDLARATEASPLSDVQPDEIWIDIDVTEQVLVAWKGTRPVYATLVSTGRPGHDTPKGVFPIWVKLSSTDMSDLGRSDVSQNYLIEQVPWVQFFKEGYGLHAAFWHDDFGRRRSHGCVNLSPRDARALFGLTTPRLPVGWSAVLPSGEERPTRVRVR